MNDKLKVELTNAMISVNSTIEAAHEAYVAVRSALKYIDDVHTNANRATIALNRLEAALIIAEETSLDESGE